MLQSNRQWILKRRPQGLAVPADFDLREADFDLPTLEDGQILIRNLAFLCAPTIRNWMDAPDKSLLPSIPLGSPIRGPSAGRVIASANPDFPVGCRVCTVSNWQDYDIVSPGNILVRTFPDGYSFIDAVGALGLNALTAYVGLLEVGQPKAGETILVSGAAGSVGSNVAQIAKIKDCRVIGIAGGKAKCDWVTKQYGIEACIDYKDGSLTENIADLCPNGVDVFFDNVGGDVLQAGIDNMAKFGRIVLCGQISGYNSDGTIARIGNMMRLIYSGIRMQGFLASMYSERFPQAMADISMWIKLGKLKHREDIRHGLEVLPMALNDVFDGTNEGTLIVSVDHEATQTA